MIQITYCYQLKLSLIIVFKVFKRHRHPSYIQTAALMLYHGIILYSPPTQVAIAAESQ
jgi:hypothetical protein